MLKIGHSTRENNPRRGAGRGAPAGIDTWTRRTTATYGPRPDGTRGDRDRLGPRSLGAGALSASIAKVAEIARIARIATFVTIAAGVVADRVTDLPRRMTGRLFAVNDDESYWRDWQIMKVHCGFGRRYRSPMFDTLVTCADCKGTGIGAIELAGLSLPCGICLGFGRLTVTTDELTASTSQLIASTGEDEV
ncbi:MAG: hypothetical protein JO345_05040 [Streptosporangiaceae bacterium]|nr:hypothetical protein [Streptosporangiaceae bacterium]